jgi:dGTPase
MLSWDKLLNPTRRKDLHGEGEKANTGAGRTALERDYDRILFATPTRRLVAKTQVYPMEKNVSVRNRLTHSYEVSNLARSIGTQLVFVEKFREKVFGDLHEISDEKGNIQIHIKRDVPSILAAVGLAHDLGNPPFGHQGEIAMQQWFADCKIKNSEIAVDQDFLAFDGNAQTFRLLARLQVLNDEYGLNLTTATLAALVKYPTIYGSQNKNGFKKHGIFQSEKNVIKEVWEQTGLTEGVRHPLAYVMEACDDIAYSIIDAEDTVKKGYASFYDLIDYLDTNSKNDPVIIELIKESREWNLKFKKQNTNFKEINELSMQMFRVFAISKMIPAATQAFIDNIDAMMAGKIQNGFELISHSASAGLCSIVKDFDKKYGFQHKDVLKLELQGSNYIKGFMSEIWSSIDLLDEIRKNKPYERFIYGSISENYKNVFSESNATIEYKKMQLMCDSISGMTEPYLIEKYDEFKQIKFAN